MAKRRKPPRPTPPAPKTEPRETPATPFALGPLVSRVRGKPIGAVTYHFEHADQRDRFEAGVWPEGVRRPGGNE